ncbi:peptide MFS transporter [Legionella hackeliae]|uniref:Peptide transport protein, POT family n=1 Tax=Legionella hackeliae TaxID=449 RepID=A0A0A8UUB3_LEGHA|nr:oligopeptide:H+ symporter [Legionella hackeliae]KTD13943.1 peptide transport protein, POT family [Legionella hackeliae]CEK10647.1 Peptide transport protein, POT family [Legionella hackeliae]STX47392.1 peptide transport protein, POT family [Legionella hackeliae]
MSRVDSKNAVWSDLPQGTVALFFIQIFSTLSFSVLYSTLVLYMTKKLELPASSANSITGIFVAANFALHLLGGYCGGRFLSNRALFCFGMLAQIIGCILLASESEMYLYCALGFFLTGSGLNVTCINCMLTQRFEPKDHRRETAFLWNYAGMNIGFLVGFTLSGYFQLSQNYQRLFLLSSLGNLIAIFICLYFWHVLDDQKTIYSRLTKEDKKRAILGGIAIVAALPFLLSQFIHFADWANKLILVTGAIMLAVAIILAAQQQSGDAREKMLAFAILMVVSTVFWVLYQIGPMGLTHFIENNVQRHWEGITIAPQWFQNVNTLCIVFGGPLLSFILNRMRSRGIQVNIPTQFALALLLIGLAFALLPAGIARASSDGMVAPGWIVLSYILQSAGELLISPIGYAMVGALVPNSLQGIMMGMWMLATGVGATLSSYSSNWMTSGQETSLPLATNSGYSDVFLNLGLFAIAASLLLFLLVPKLKHWINDKNSNVTNEAASVMA